MDPLETGRASRDLYPTSRREADTYLPGDALVEHAPGMLIDRYRVERVVGRGGMGMVYLVRHVYLQSRHALKVLHRAGGQVQQRLLSEARAQARVRHRNVVPVTDFIDQPNLQGFVMEFVEGMNLLELIHHQPLSIEQLDAVAEGIFRGVGAAHDAGLLHRDLKPANVLIRWQDGAPHPLVCDFGLVRTEDAEAHTRPGVVMGTPGYMSPEQLRGRADVDVRTDVFSMGALLYTLCVGRPPFASRNLFQLEEEMHTWQPSLDGARIAIPERMRSAILAALRLERRERPDSMEQMHALWSGAVAPPPAKPTVQIPPGTHPTLEQLVDGSDAVQAHLKTCARCRITRRRSEPSPAASEPSRERPAPVRTFALSTVEAPDVVAERAVRSAGSARRSPATFVGRNAAFEATQRGLVDGPMVSVIGAPGVGKTRLAMEVLETAELPGVQSRVFCNLEDVQTEAQLISAIATAVGRPCGSRGQLGGVLSSLGPMLLVLDPFEHLVAVASDLVADLSRAAPELRLLLTSRLPLDLFELHPVNLEPLGPAESSLLFRQRARRHRRSAGDWTADELQAIERVVEQLDGLPLAIELAAARTSVLSLAALEQRLTARFKVLRGRRTGSRRHSTLKAAFDGSWELLEPWERAALAQCSVFRGSFSLEAAESVLDLELHDADPLDGLDALRRHSLLQVHPNDRYSLLHAVRDYASERLDDEQTAVRHARWYGARYRDAGWRPYGLGELLPDLQNLRVAFETAQKQIDFDAVLALAHPMLRVYTLNGPYQAGLDLVEQLLGQATTLRERAALLGHRGWMRLRKGQYEDAEQDFHVALDALGDLEGTDSVRAAFQNGLGVVFAEQARYREAREPMHAAVEAWERVGQAHAAARCRANLGGCLRALADPAAQTLLEAAVSELIRFGDHSFAAITQNNLSLVYRDTGQTERALAVLREAIERHHRAGTSQHGASARTNIGFLLLDANRLDEAEAELRRALEVHRTAGNTRWTLFTRGGLGLVMLELGDWEQGRTEVEAVIQQTDRLGDALGGGLFRARLGRACLERGAHAQALDLLNDAVEKLDAVDAITEQGHARCWRAAVLRLMGQVDAAHEDIREATRRAERLGAQGWRLRTVLERSL